MPNALSGLTPLQPPCSPSRSLSSGAQHSLSPCLECCPPCLARGYSLTSKRPLLKCLLPSETPSLAPVCVAAWLYCVRNTHHHATYLVSLSSLSAARTGAQGVWGVGRGISVCSVHCHLFQYLGQCLANSRHLVIVC